MVVEWYANSLGFVHNFTSNWQESKKKICHAVLFHVIRLDNYFASCWLHSISKHTAKESPHIRWTLSLSHTQTQTHTSTRYLQVLNIIFLPHNVHFFPYFWENIWNSNINLSVLTHKVHICTFKTRVSCILIVFVLLCSFVCPLVLIPWLWWYFLLVSSLNPSLWAPAAAANRSDDLDYDPHWSHTDMFPLASAF